MLRNIFILLFVCSVAYSQSNNTTGTISNLEGGAAVRTKINEDIEKGNDQHDSIVVYRGELDNHTDSIDVHDGKINTNITNIATNTSNIATNVSDIDTLEYTVGDSATVSFSTNTINEYTSGTGVTVDGVKLKDNNIGYYDSHLTAGYFRNVYFYWSAGADSSNIRSASNNTLMIESYGDYVSIIDDLVPLNGVGYNLGNSSWTWDRGYIDTLYSPNTHLYFYDKTAGIKTLSELAETCTANDSITVHRTEIDNLNDSITAHDIKINANIQSAADNADSLAVHLDTLQELRTDINAAHITTASFTSCTYNSTTNINIGDTGDYSLLIHYTAYRTISAVVEYQSGTINILYNPSTADIYYTSDYIGEDISISITADVDSGNLRLNIIVDDTNTNNAYFAYRIYSQLQ